MLKKTALIASAALALATLASPALAQSFSPTNSTQTLSGVLNLEQTQNINCQVDITISIDGAGAATVTSRTFSPGDIIFCGGIVQPTGTWTVAADSTSQITAAVGAQSIAGNCFGSVVGAWDNTTRQLTFTNASVPGNPGPCFINGTLQGSANLQIVP